MDAGNVISALGVLVTGIFSCLIWQANKHAAKAAKDSAALDDQKHQGDHLKVANREEVVI
ncbi:hypothetical protein [Bacillus toyonensis]|uniref:hypothetical protein n=1 Tax=Bacillus toyonensis TaxID=155322 RepID=UPI000BF18F3E|nr:hypothetical protein [Bacillus toyonensis]PEO25784.1 hypothetical protein CN589_23150 [Bacillus toyonensis]PFY03783.1 hypothetical protein COL45_08850 [Bacillus toyonensis]PHB85860.1 hypothetical protein COE93_01355 [Bacillus toyonensis]